MRKNLKSMLAIILCGLLLVGCSNKKTSSDSANTATNSPTSSAAKDNSTSSEASSSDNVIKTMDSTDVKFDTADFYKNEIPKDATTIALNDTSAKVTGSGAAVNGNDITISSGGVYVVTGTLKDGQIIVNAGDKDDVQIILNGATINCSDSSPIYVQKANKVTLSLQAGTVNSLSDTKNYTFTDTKEKEPNATVFSKSDFVINGTGTLKVEANYNSGITSKDKLKITEATILITSVDKGILGRDMLAAQDANITLKTTGDGLKSTNSKDATVGFIVLKGCSVNITSGTDGISAATTILTKDSDIAITSGGGNSKSSKKSDTGFKNKGNNTQASSDNTETASTKGMKAASAITINGGKITIDSADDTLHSNYGITITDGTLNLTAGDDGIHANTELDIKGGTININKSYEGIESSLINIEEGTIHVTSSDDGINVSGGSDSSTTNSNAGQNNFNSISGKSLNISGGYLYVNAEGDGLDSNNSMKISGGTILVNGPLTDGNGALDYNGTCEITGGLLIAAGSSGMAMAPSDTSSQHSIGVLFSQSQKAGTLVHIEDSKGNAIATFAPTKAFTSVVVSSPDISKGGKYTVYTGGSSTGKAVNGYYSDGTYQGGTKMVQFTVSDNITWVDESGITTHTDMMGGGMRGNGNNTGDKGGFGGKMGDRPDANGGTPPDGNGGNMKGAPGTNNNSGTTDDSNNSGTTNNNSSNTGDSVNGL